MTRDNKKGSATADQSVAEPVNDSVDNAIYSLPQAEVTCQRKVIKAWLDTIVDYWDKLKALSSTSVGEIELYYLEKEKNLDRIHISTECIQQLAEAVGETLEEKCIPTHGYEIYRYQFFYKLKEVFAITHERLPGFEEEKNSKE